MGTVGSTFDGGDLRREAARIGRRIARARRKLNRAAPRSTDWSEARDELDRALAAQQHLLALVRSPAGARNADTPIASDAPRS